MRGFTLFKVWTLVLLVGGLVPFGEEIHGQQMPSSDYLDCKGLDATKQKDCLDINTQMAKAKIDSFKAQASNRCKEAEKTFDEARRGLTKACGEAGGVLAGTMKGFSVFESQGTSVTNCELNILRCQNCSSDPNFSWRGNEIGCGKFDTGDDDDDTDTSSNFVNSTFQTMQNASMVGATAALSMSGSKRTSKAEVSREVLQCIPRSAEELDDLKKDIKDEKESVRDRQKAVIEAQDAVNDAKNDYQQTLNNLKSESEAADERLKDRVESIKRRIEEQDAKLAEQVMRLQGEYDKAQAEIQRIQRQKTQADMALVEAQANLDRQCHATALKQMDDHRKEQRELMKKKLYTPGGFNSVLSGSGQSDREKDRLRVTQFFNDCKADAAYASALTSAKRAKDFAIQTADGEISILQQAVTRIEAAVKGLQTDERTKIQTQALRELQLEQEAYTKKVADLERRRQTETQRVQQVVLSKNQQLNLLNSQLLDDQNDLSDKLDRARIIRSYAGAGASGKMGKTDAAIEASHSVQNAAQFAMAYCCNAPDGKATCEAACARTDLKSDECKKAYKEPNSAASSGTSP